VNARRCDLGDSPVHVASRSIRQLEGQDYATPSARAQSRDEPTIRYGCDVAAATGDERLERIIVRDTSTGVEEALESDGLFVLIGSEPERSGSPGSEA
jgi:thioredoxin reductase